MKLGKTETIERFYEAFSRRDWRTMGACYSPSVHFSDEAFDLQGQDATHMWHMLCERGTDLVVKWRDVREQPDGTVAAHWDAWYTFSTTRRKVHNSVDASFTFGADGLVVRHVDRFGFWRWARQALGVPGFLLGWTPFLRGKVRRAAAQGLAAFKRGV